MSKGAVFVVTSFITQDVAIGRIYGLRGVWLLKRE